MQLGSGAVPPWAFRKCKVAIKIPLGKDFFPFLDCARMCRRQALVARAQISKVAICNNPIKDFFSTLREILSRLGTVIQKNPHLLGLVKLALYEYFLINSKPYSIQFMLFFLYNDIRLHLSNIV